MNNSLTRNQLAVLEAFHEFGRPMDDVTLTAFTHHIERVPQSSSGIRSRRAELSRKMLIETVGTKKLTSGRLAAVHALTTNGRLLAESLFGVPVPV